jgi:hypothetical protein
MSERSDIGMSGVAPGDESDIPADRQPVADPRMTGDKPAAGGEAQGLGAAPAAGKHDPEDKDDALAKSDSAGKGDSATESGLAAESDATAKSDVDGKAGDKQEAADKQEAGDKQESGSKTEATGDDKAAGKTEGENSTEANSKAESKTGAKSDGKTGTDSDGKSKSGTETPTAPTAAALAAASQGRATRVLRRANPVRVARSTARSTSAWAKRPSGRLILPAIIAALLLGAAGTAGAYLVPKALRSVPTPSATPAFAGDAGASGGVVSGAPSLGGLPAVPGTSSAPVVGGTVPATQAPVVGGARPADVLTSWAQQTGTRAGIPVVAVQAYGYAELVLARTAPSCHLSWTTIAAIAKVESSHGSANGAVLNVDGSVAPPIFGLPLDGKGGRQEIRDTDQGALDGDPQFDRAIGPLQFVPQTWTAVSVGNGVDADNNGISDPNDIDDASLAAAKYLCQNGRDLAKPDAWWDAILTYNAIRPYAQKVFDAANEYGRRSRV